MVLISSYFELFSFPTEIGLVGTLATLNIITASICIIFGSIILARKKYIKEKNIKKAPEEKQRKKEEKQKKKLEEKQKRTLEKEQKQKEEEERKRKLEEEQRKEIIDKIKKMINVSTKLKFSTMRNVLGMDEKTFENKIFDWANEFGFIIEEDVVIINKDRINDFFVMLDKEFKSWEDKEKSKDGKI